MYILWQVSQEWAKSNGVTTCMPLQALRVNAWIDMDPAIQEMCELGLQRGTTTATLFSRKERYQISYVEMTQINLDTGTLRKIRRLLLQQSP